MKKLISCLLAVLLVCSVMSMNVFADNTPVVGNHGGNDINNGVNEEDFPGTNPNGSSSADVTVNFGQTTDSNGTTNNPGDDNNSVIVHKYAVDITYGSFLLDLTNLQLGKDTNGTDGIQDDEKLYMVWDVNTHKYVLCFATTDAEGVITYTPADIGGQNDATTEDDVAADILQTPVKLPGYVTITNHSDLSVNSKVEIAPDGDKTRISWAIAEEVAATADRDTGADSYNADKTVVNQLIGKAVAGSNGGNGEATNGTTYNFTATPTDTDGWLGVIGNFINNNQAAKIGTITVTIEP